MKIKFGVTRMVFVFDTIVIKIPNFTYSWRNFIRGILSNIDENRTWIDSELHINGDMRYLLCPVLFCSFGGLFLIMKKADVKAFEKYYLNNGGGDVFKVWEQNYFGGDCKLENFGMLNGDPVKIDYSLDYID